MVRFSSKWGRNPLLARAPVALISPLLLYISATPGAPFDTFKRTQQFVAQNTVFQGEQPGFRCEKFTSASNRKTVLCVAFERRLAARRIHLASISKHIHGGLPTEQSVDRKSGMKEPFAQTP